MEQTAKNWPVLAEKILGILSCLSCGDGLRNEAEGLVCSGCARKYPLVNGPVRFVDTQHYSGSFGFQWKLYARTQLDNEQSRRSEHAFRRRTGFAPEDLAGKLVLDVGCGMGRFAEVATRWGAPVVGIDLSMAAEVTSADLASSHATIFQAHVFHLPFAAASFDYIYSWRILDTFDWYSPWYQSKHTYEEVFRWFESCGLRDLRVIDQPIAVQGRKAWPEVSGEAFERQEEATRCVE